MLRQTLRKPFSFKVLIASAGQFSVMLVSWRSRRAKNKQHKPLSMCFLRSFAAKILFKMENPPAWLIKEHEKLVLSPASVHLFGARFRR
jgi:hypothetical protein